MNLMGSSSYKKYIRFFSGIVLIIILISPITKLFNMEERLSYLFEKNNFQIEMKEINQELLLAEEEQKEAIWKGYQKVLQEQIESVFAIYHLETKEIQLEIEQEEESYGKIKAMRIVCGKKEKQKQESTEQIEIENIEIKGIEVEEKIKDSISQSTQEQFHMQEIKKELAKMYQLEEDCIFIKMKEG